MREFDYEANKKRVLDPSNNRRLSVGLFAETSDTPHIPPPFTLAEWKKVFLECMDPTDYKPMKRLLNNLPHWKLIMENQTLSPIIAEWKEEINMRLKSEAVENLRALATTKEGACRAILNAEWEKKSRGRPAKAKAPSAAYRMDKDAERLGI